MTISLGILIMALITGLVSYCAILDLEKKHLENHSLFEKPMYKYFLISALCLVGAVSTYFVYSNSISFYAMAKLLITYIAVSIAAIYDFKLKKIPNMIPIGLFIVSIAILVIESIFTDNATAFLISSFLGCLSSMLILYIAAKVSKGGVGFGDVKLFGAIGFCVGFYAVFTVMTLSILCCAIVGIPTTYLKKKTIRGDLPFAPFIYLGYVITMLLSLY